MWAVWCNVEWNWKEEFHVDSIKIKKKHYITTCLLTTAIKWKDTYMCELADLHITVEEKGILLLKTDTSCVRGDERVGPHTQSRVRVCAVKLDLRHSDVMNPRRQRLRPILFWLFFISNLQLGWFWGPLCWSAPEQHTEPTPTLVSLLLVAVCACALSLIVCSSPLSLHIEPRRAQGEYVGLHESISNQHGHAFVSVAVCLPVAFTHDESSLNKPH